MSGNNGKYVLRCILGGEEVREQYTTTCPLGHASLLRTEYRKKKLQDTKYAGDLPVQRLASC